MDSPKICKNCKHFRRSDAAPWIYWIPLIGWIMYWIDGITWAKCTWENKDIIDLVTGEVTPQRISPRQARLDRGGHCGVEARHFEAKFSTLQWLKNKVSKKNEQ